MVNQFLLSFVSYGHKTFLKHPYYVSVTEINHNSKEKLIEISSKIFTNDLETLLRSKTKSYIDVIHPKDKAATSKIISTYLLQHLEIIIDGKKYIPEYLGYEIEDEALWSYLQIRGISSVKKIQINNTILYDYKKEQINMMHVSANGLRRSSKLNFPETMANFEL